MQGQWPREGMTATCPTSGQQPSKAVQDHPTTLCRAADTRHHQPQQQTLSGGLDAAKCNGFQRQR